MKFFLEPLYYILIAYVLYLTIDYAKKRLSPRKSTLHRKSG